MGEITSRIKSRTKDEKLPIAALIINLLILSYSILLPLFSINDVFSMITLSVFLLLAVFIVLLAFRSQFKSRFFSSIFFLVAGISNFILVPLFQLLLLVGLLNIGSFAWNLMRGISFPKLTKKHLALPVILLIIISPIFIPHTIKLEGKNSITLQFYSKPENFPKKAIPTLADKGIEIILTISPSNMGNAVNITKQLNDNDINVHAQLIVGEENGTYANESNANEFKKHYSNFESWTERNGLDFEGVFIDSEPDWRFLNKLTNLGKTMSLIKIESVIAKEAGDKHAEAISIYQDLIQDAEQDGYEVTLIGMPMVADDLLDGDDFIQKAIGVASMPPREWDSSTFMVYRSTYEDILGSDPGSYFVYTYGKTVKEIIDNSNISIGVVGYSKEKKLSLEHSVYQNIDKISRDVKVLNALGFSKVQIFSLQSFTETFGREGLKELETSGKASFSPDIKVAALRGGILIFDSLEDILRIG